MHEHVSERARITSEMYASEVEDIKKAVKEEIQRLEEQRESTKAALEALESGAVPETTASPLEYAQYVDYTSLHPWKE